MDAGVKDVAGPNKGRVAVKTVTRDVAHKRDECADKSQGFLADSAIHGQDVAACDAAMKNE